MLRRGHRVRGEQDLGEIYGSGKMTRAGSSVSAQYDTGPTGCVWCLDGTVLQLLLK